MTHPCAAITTGLERCLTDPPDLLRGSQLGLLMNQASVDGQFRYAHQLLDRYLPGQLQALFGPQHGFWSREQDNMIETPHDEERRLQIPVHSLYADQRQPTPEMLDGLDCFLIDLQDVGTRVYTFIWTVAYCLEACAAAKIPVVVLDRPNPLGGTVVEGPLLQPAYRSFIGRHSIPMRHGLTIAEMAVYLNRSMRIHADLHVVPMTGWQRSMHWTDTDRVWIGPSPNLPRIEGVDVYPGQVLIEGTNLSEGRGTTTPFEVIGAPFIDSDRLIQALQTYDLPGVVWRPISFEPTFQKWHGRCCHGLYLHVLDRDHFLPYRTSLAILASIHQLWPHEFAWLQPPYEYEPTRMPIDILTGSDTFRTALAGAVTPDEIARLSPCDASAWWAQVADCLLYSR